MTELKFIDKRARTIEHGTVNRLIVGHSVKIPKSVPFGHLSECGIRVGPSDFHHVQLLVCEALQFVGSTPIRQYSRVRSGLFFKLLIVRCVLHVSILFHNPYAVNSTGVPIPRGKALDYDQA